VNPIPSKPQDIWRAALSDASLSDVVTPPPVEAQAQPMPVLRRSTRIAAPKVQSDQRYRESNSHTLVLQCDKSDGSNPEPMDEKAISLLCVSEATLDSITPRSARQAVNSSLSVMWLSAMNREKACHVKNKTFGTSPPNAKIIPADWVFRVKYRGGLLM
jgi:hypothetical protein